MRIVPAGDAALLVEFPARIDPAVSAAAVTLARAVRDACGGRIRDVVVGYCSATVYFDPLQVDVTWLESVVRGVAGRPEPFHAEADAPADWESGVRSIQPPVDDAVVDVPVCYGGVYGPDLPEVAAFAGLTIDEVIALHSATTYRVYVVGFVPGFPYMASVDPRIAIPRRTTPRTRVAAGSVAIAAGQTGIYPCETPGGWHLIGRTHVNPYDPSRPEPFLFKPGDAVRFHPVDRDEFDSRA
ncbi:MAG: 5-oxoprolinase subunit PxpB [Acidobacteriota bacterium]